MEKIKPKLRDGLLIKDNQFFKDKVQSEIGYFGYILSDKDKN